MLTQKQIEQFLNAVSSAKMQMDGFAPTSWLHHLEARFTLFCLEGHLRRPTMTVENDLILFLKARWEKVLINTNIQYLHDFTNPANQACISIARGLGIILNDSYLGFLMPTLFLVKSQDYTTSPYIDNDLLLHDLVLSDCNTRIIHLPDVLDCSQEDGILKHNSLVLNKIKILSPSEQNRLLSRHPTVNTYYDALKARVDFKISGDTVGAALTRLIQGLRDGGEKKTRKADNSGAAANQAVVEFYEYMETLDDAIKVQLMNATKYDRYKGAKPELLSIESLWHSLTCHKENKFKDVTFCVESIANSLEEILVENPWLYNLLSYWGEAPTTLSELNTSILETKVLMETALPFLEKHPCYVEGDNMVLIYALLDAIQSNQNFPLLVNDVASFVKQYEFFLKEKQNVTLISVVLKQISKSYPHGFMLEVLEKLDIHEKKSFKMLTGFLSDSVDFRKPELPTFFHKKRPGEERLDSTKHPRMESTGSD